MRIHSESASHLLMAPRQLYFRSHTSFHAWGVCVNAAQLEEIRILRTSSHRPSHTSRTGLRELGVVLDDRFSYSDGNVACDNGNLVESRLREVDHNRVANQLRPDRSAPPCWVGARAVLQ